MILHRDVQIEPSILIILIEIAPRKSISHPNFRSGIHEDVPVYTGKPPHILIFKIASITPLVNFNCQNVLTWSCKMRYIELSRCTATFAETDSLTIYPEIESRSNAFKVHEYLLVRPIFRYSEFLSVRTDWIVILWNTWWIWIERINYVRVNGFVVPQHLPVAWNLYFIPLSIIEIFSVKIPWPFIGIFRKMKFPFSREEYAILWILPIGS